MYSGYLEKGLGSCTWCTHIVHMFNICICTVDIWRTGWDLEHGVHILCTLYMFNVCILYSGCLEEGLVSYTWCAHIFYMFNVCAAQWISVERVGILYMVYIYMYFTVDIWRMGWDLVHGVHILCTYLIYVLYSGYLERGLGSCAWCTYIVCLFNVCTVQWLSEPKT